MLRLYAAMLLLLTAVVASGCGLPGQTSPRDLGEHFADALEGRSDAAFETFLAPDASIYLQGGGQITSPALREYVDRMKANKQLFHRDGPVYVTPNGVGWLLGITRGSSEAAPTLWMEASITSGRISRVWIHFTYESLQAIHSPPATYAANMSKLGLPLPVSWADGTPAMLAAAERYDAQAEGTPIPWRPLLVAIAAVALGGRLVLLRKPTRGRRQLATHSPRTRNGALLDSVRMRRAVVVAQTAIPVQGLPEQVVRGETG